MPKLIRFPNVNQLEGILEPDQGGLGTDASAFNGLVKIVGSTSSDNYTTSFIPYASTTSLDDTFVSKTSSDQDNSFQSPYLVFNHGGSSDVDYIGFDDTSNTFVFNADTSKTVASGNANIAAASFIPNGGNPSQFLKGDGGLDSTSYASQAYVLAQLTNAVVDASANTASQIFTFTRYSGGGSFTVAY